MYLQYHLPTIQTINLMANFKILLKKLRVKVGCGKQTSFSSNGRKCYMEAIYK